MVSRESGEERMRILPLLALLASGLAQAPDESPRIAVEDRSFAKGEQRRAGREVPGAGSIVRPPLPLGEGWGEGTPPQVERRASTTSPENAAFGFRRHFSLTPKPLSLWERGEDGTPFLAIMIRGDSSGAEVRVRHRKLTVVQAQTPPRKPGSVSGDTFPSPPSPSPEGEG